MSQANQNVWAHCRGRWFSTSPERGILPVHLPTTFRSHFTAKFSVQIVNIPMHIVCIPAGYFRCIHLSRTVGSSNPALIINDFRCKNRACFTDVYESNVSPLSFWGNSENTRSSSARLYNLARWRRIRIFVFVSLQVYTQTSLWPHQINRLLYKALHELIIFRKDNGFLTVLKKIHQYKVI